MVEDLRPCCRYLRAVCLSEGHPSDGCRSWVACPAEDHQVLHPALAWGDEAVLPFPAACHRQGLSFGAKFEVSVHPLGWADGWAVAAPS